MKRELAKYPFDNYYIYIVYHKQEKRRYAVLYPIDKTKFKRKTVSYARYLMSVKLGRFLTKDEEVDHIDNNKMNDSIENLQILSPYENKLKQGKHHGRKYVLLKCPYCKKFFEIPKRDSYLQRPFSYTTCSRKCSYSFLSIILKKENEDFVKKALSENFVKEFIKH